MVLAKIGTMQADDLPPAIDVETTDGLGPTAVARGGREMDRHTSPPRSVAPPIVYVGSYFWRRLGRRRRLNELAAVARAVHDRGVPDDRRIRGPTWAFWQYTSIRLDRGIDAAVDVDRWNGDMASFTAFLGRPARAATALQHRRDSISCPEDCGPCGTIDAQSGFVIDNGDACFQAGGPAAYMRSVTDAGYDDKLVWTHTTDDATEANYATWNIYFASAGHYKIEAYTAAAYAQSKQAKYVITGATTQSVMMDQTAADGWQTIGTFDFNRGGHQSIHLGDNTGEPSSGNIQLVFDAIRMTPASTGSGSGSGSGSAGPASGAPDGTPDDGNAGGCNASGGSCGFALLGVALVGLVRRRGASRARSARACACRRSSAYGGVERRRADHQVSRVVVEIFAADVVLALRRDGVRGAADLGDELARVARPRPQQRRLDQRRVDLQAGLGAAHGFVDEIRHLVGAIAQRRHRDQLAPESCRDDVGGRARDARARAPRSSRTGRSGASR